MQRVLRCVVGILAAVAFSASVLEVLIPDVHDGDARSGLLADASHTNGTNANVPVEAPVRPHHAHHVDHCMHAHVAAVATGASIDVAPLCHGKVPITSAAALVSVATTPSFRPPIL